MRMRLARATWLHLCRRTHASRQSSPRATPFPGRRRRRRARQQKKAEEALLRALAAKATTETAEDVDADDGSSSPVELPRANKKHKFYATRVEPLTSSGAQMTTAPAQRTRPADTHLMHEHTNAFGAGSNAIDASRMPSGAPQYPYAMEQQLPVYRPCVSLPPHLLRALGNGGGAPSHGA